MKYFFLFLVPMVIQRTIARFPLAFATGIGLVAYYLDPAAPDLTAFLRILHSETWWKLVAATTFVLVGIDIFFTPTIPSPSGYTCTTLDQAADSTADQAGAGTPVRP